MTIPLRLLLLEDNSTDAALALHQLRRAGYEPIVSLAETEEKYREHLQCKPEIILADFLMPEFDALRALEILQQKELDIPFIVVSGSIGEALAVQVIQRGATDYIIKDRLEHLGRAVTRALELKQVLDAKRRTEQALCESEELSRNAFDYTNVAMFVADLDYRFKRVNNAFIELFGYSQPELLKLSMNDITHPDDLAENAVNLQALRAGEVRYFQIEKRYVHKDGQVLWCLANVSLLHDANGKPLHYVAQVQDVTERIIAEKALCESQDASKALEEQFRQSQKMEAVGQLAAGVAHDFNNLLTVILGYTELCIDSMPTGNPYKEAIVQIRKAAVHASGLTRQLLAFGRKQILAPVVLDLNTLMGEIEKLLHRLIGADIDLTMRLQPGLGCVRVDPGQVEQIVMNLVINARDAMPEGGRITIQTQNTVLSESQVQSHLELPAGPYSMLVVSDTGSGMTDATMARLFEPFFTTKDIGKGTGLGLATVFGIVKQSGGFIEVDTKLGYGSCFRTFLPQVHEAIRPGEADLGLLKMPSGGETVLLVEDEDGVLQLTQMVLESSGYKVLSTRNGVEAVQVSRDYAEVIHLLFADVVMPKMSGRQVAELLAMSRPEMKVLYMSGYTDDTMVRHGISGAEANFLAKPFTPAALARKVREVLDGKKERQDCAAGEVNAPAIVEFSTS